MVRRPPCTAAITSALRRATQRTVLAGGRLTGVSTLPSGPRTACLAIRCFIWALTLLKRPARSHATPTPLKSGQQKGAGFSQLLRKTFSILAGFRRCSLLDLLFRLQHGRIVRRRGLAFAAFGGADNVIAAREGGRVAGRKRVRHLGVDLFFLGLGR